MKKLLIGLIILGTITMSCNKGNNSTDQNVLSKDVVGTYKQFVYRVGSNSFITTVTANADGTLRMRFKDCCNPEYIFTKIKLAPDLTFTLNEVFARKNYNGSAGTPNQWVGKGYFGHNTIYLDFKCITCYDRLLIDGVK